MSARGPGDGPGRPSPKPKRKRKPQQTAAAAENARQVRRGKVRGPRKTKARDYKPPVQPAAPAGDTKSDADLGRAKKFERTPKYREAVRDTYKEQSHKRRRQILNNDAPGPAGAEAQRIHDERIRVQDYVRRAKEFASNPDAKVEDKDEAEKIRKGLRVLKHQRQEALGRLQAMEHASPKYGTGEAEDGDKDHGILEGISSAIKAAAGVGTGTSKAKGAVASNEEFLGNIKRVEKASGPIDFAYQQTLKPKLDATTKILEQTNRLASASAGAAEGAIDAKGGVGARLAAAGKGAVEGAVHNDKSYVDLAKKAGLKGAAAVIVGTAGDIVFDPSTYASFGLTAPAKAAERAAARKIARKLSPQIKKAAKAGDEELQAKLAAQYEEQLAAARKKIADKGLETETRGVQAGVRLPGGRTVQTKGRVTAAVGKQATKATAKAQASKAMRPLNEVLRAFAPHAREAGVRPAEQATRQAVKRETNAIRNRFAREGRQLGKFIQRATGGDVEKVRELVDALESGTVRNLDDRMRQAAEHMEEFHTRVADAFEREGLPRPSLRDTVLASKDVQDALGVARKVLDDRVTTAGRAAERADHAADVAHAGESAPRSAAANAKVADAHTDLAAAESLADDIAAREHPITHAEEQELVDRLTGVVDRLRDDAHTNMARTRMNDELGAIRRGEHEAPEIRKALREEDFYRKRAADQRKAGNRTAARASEAKARQARAVIKAHRAEVEPQHLAAVREEGGNVLSGRAGHLERLLGQLQERVAHQAPEAYVPRQTAAAMDAERGGKPLLVPANPQGKAGHEMERLERRRQGDVREEKPDYLSDELPLIEARYGMKMGRRLASAALWRRMIQSQARPVTGEFPIEGDNVLYRLENGQPHRIDPKDRDANLQAMAEASLAHGLGQDTGVYAVPKQLDEAMTERIKVGDEKSATGRLYDKWLRGFKAMNTILRPGFFLTTLAGNTWQQFLADISPREMARAYRMLASIRKADLDAVTPGAGIRKALLDKASDGQVYAVDGKAMTFGDVFNEAIDAGVVRTGSRIGDPTELTLEEQAKRRLGGKGVKAKTAATTEWLGELAEDLDDMTKAVMYVNARTKLGMSSREAAERVFTKMIDYSDLSPAERTFFKRVMPFYVYTARNLPIQIKSILARPGKLANYEKVRQALAQASGLGSDWEGQRTEAEQERMPVALPGVKAHGFQVYLDPRLPVADIAAPAQLEEGPGGAVRMLERYGSGVAPPVKVPLELLLFKRRLDYDRPIDVPGSPPAAGALLKLIGATKKGTYVQPATGEKYTGAIPAVDYLLRTMGGSPGSLAAGIGSGVPDRSNINPVVRGATSFAGGAGVSASDPLYAVLDALRTETEKHYQKRSELKGRGLRDSAEDIRNENAIDALNNVKRKIQGAIGFPEQKGHRLDLERERIDIALRDPATLRAERARMRNIRKRAGG